jgi:cellobiose phosphorylase
VFSYARLVLGALPEELAFATVVEAAGDGRTLRASNGLAGPFAGGVAFASAATPSCEAEISFTADRRGFLGVGGAPERPRALAEDAVLDGRTGARLDPCFAHQVRLSLPRGTSAECVFVLGEGDDPVAAEALVARFARASAFEETRRAVRARWDATLESVQVTTPSPGLDLLLNGWLVYQTLSCRLWARTAFYQSGGAFGYRDQLQDAAALVLLWPDLTRAQILLHAAHQFIEGDVLHWWHPPLGRGTRTRFSDDLLWLPWVTAHYVATTGDAGVLEARVASVTARLLEPGEDEAYLPTQRANEEVSVYEHCCRAIDRSLGVGDHGLPRMGTGDWNDGMNRVGREGRGESVWMAFFLHDVLRAFEPLCHMRSAPRALAELGQRDRALALLEMILPVHHARTPEEVATYRVEPYVVAADVYAVSPHVGRGGWTWYTGSSGWMFRVALESVLGLRLEQGRRLVLRPCIPDTWPEFRIELRLPGADTRYAIHVRNPSGSAACVTRVRVDGVDLPPQEGAAIWPVAGDGARHDVEVELGRAPQ